MPSLYSNRAPCRLLTSLAARGYVRKNPDTGRYRLGFKAFEVGSLIAGRGAIREVAAPFLRSLMLATTETVHLGVLDEWEVVYISKMESGQPLHMYSRIGRRAPLHCTALSKALAAWEPEDRIDKFLRRRLRAYTPSTLTEPGDARSARIPPSEEPRLHDHHRLGRRPILPDWMKIYPFE